MTVCREFTQIHVAGVHDKYISVRDFCKGLAGAQNQRILHISLTNSVKVFSLKKCTAKDWRFLLSR